MKPDPAPEAAPEAAIRACVFTDEVAPDLPEAIRRSVEAGASGLELRSRLFGKSITEISDEDARRVRALAVDAGAEVAVIASPVGKCDMENAEECRRHQQHFERMVALTELLGTPLIRGFALWRPTYRETPDTARPDMERVLPRIVEFLTPIVRRAEGAGVRFCLEMEGATMVGTAAEARAVLDALGSSPALGVTWDVNNGLACGEQPFPEGYALIRGRVYHVHVKPNAEKSLATVGDSPLTYQEILAVLLRDGYHGWAGIEHWGTPEEMLKGVRELAELLRRL